MSGVRNVCGVEKRRDESRCCRHECLRHDGKNLRRGVIAMYAVERSDFEPVCSSAGGSAGRPVATGGAGWHRSGGCGGRHRAPREAERPSGRVAATEDPRHGNFSAAGQRGIRCGGCLATGGTIATAGRAASGVSPARSSLARSRRAVGQYVGCMGSSGRNVERRPGRENRGDRYRDRSDAPGISGFLAFSSRRISHLPRRRLRVHQQQGHRGAQLHPAAGAGTGEIRRRIRGRTISPRAITRDMGPPWP